MGNARAWRRRRGPRWRVTGKKCCNGFSWVQYRAVEWPVEWSSERAPIVRTEACCRDREQGAGTSFCRRGGGTCMYSPPRHLDTSKRRRTASRSRPMWRNPQTPKLSPAPSPSRRLVPAQLAQHETSQSGQQPPLLPSCRQWAMGNNTASDPRDRHATGTVWFPRSAWRRNWIWNHEFPMRSAGSCLPRPVQMHSGTPPLILLSGRQSHRRQCCPSRPQAS